MMTVFRKPFIVANTHFSKPVETLTCSGDLRASAVNQPLLFTLPLLKRILRLFVCVLYWDSILSACELNFHLNSDSTKFCVNNSGANKNLYIAFRLGSIVGLQLPLVAIIVKAIKERNVYQIINIAALSFSQWCKPLHHHSSVPCRCMPTPKPRPAFV